MNASQYEPTRGDGYAVRRTGRIKPEVGESAGHSPHGVEYGHERLPVNRASVVIRKRRRRGPGRLGLTEVLSQLSGRDISLMDFLAEHRFLTTQHLESFFFHDHATTASGARVARRVLARLERDELVARTRRRIGGLRAGSGSTVWMLTSAGQRLRAVREGRGAVGKVREPGERFIAHYLAIADTRLALVQAERAGQLVVLQSVIEPRAWRRYTGNGGGVEILKPDMAAITVTSADDEFEHHWFIEIDRGTESLPTLLKQCDRYEAYRRSGQAHADHGVFPIILWVVPDAHRVNQLQDRLAGARSLDSSNYRVTTLNALVQILRGGAE